MPERNLVTSNSFKVFMVALSIVAMQVGCSKLRNSSALLNQDYLIEEPNFNKDPAAAEVAKTTKQAESPGRFVNDPQKALDELIELGGEFVEGVADDNEDPADIIDDAEAEIFAVAQASYVNALNEEKSNPVPPPAPSIKDNTLAAIGASSDQVAESNPVADLMVGNAQQTSSKALDVMAAAAVRDPIRLTGTSPSQLRPINPASHATSESPGIIKLSTMQPLRPHPQQDKADADCSHIDCDCMKPKLKPELPFAEPVSFPQSNQKTQTSPSSPLSRPLSPIMIDRTTRQVDANDQANMKNNSLRLEVNSDLRSGKIVQAVQPPVARDPGQPEVKNQLKNSFQPIVSAIESPVVDEELGQVATAIEPVKTEIAQTKTTSELPKTKYSGFEISPACQTCHSTQCNGQCGELQDPSEQFNAHTETQQPMVAQTEFAQTDTRDPTNPENVVIVATLNKDTIPPFADPPNLDDPALMAKDMTSQVTPIDDQASQTDGGDIEQAGNQIIAEAVSKSATPLADPNSFAIQSTDLAPTDAMDEAFLASQQNMPLVDTNSFMPESIDNESAESMEAQDLSEQEWIDIFGPVVTDAQNASANAGCSECGTGECKESCLGEAKKQLVNADFAPPTPIEFPAQPEPAKISSEFVPNPTSPAGHQAEVASSDSAAWDAPESGAIAVSWVAPATANFSPIQPTPEPTTKPNPIVTPDPVAPIEPESATSNADADSIAVPNSDATEDVDVVDDMDEGSSSSDEPNVVVEVIDNTVPWDVKLDETIETVRGQVAQEGDPLTRNGMEVNLRLLEILQRQLLTAEENVNVMSNDEREYWQHQLDAITMMLPEENQSESAMDRHNAAYLTLGHLRKAVERLESIAKLDVANGKFCTEISGFGKFKPFSNTTFKSGQRTLVYCEVENYMSIRQVENFQTSFHTKLRGSYVVYDEQGRAVQQAEYPMVEDVARQRRRDFYLYFPIQIGKLAPGNYRLELLIEDLSNNKTASLNPGMKFQVEK